MTDAQNFTISRGFAGTTAAAIPDNSYLLLIGSAYAEGTSNPTATTRNPIKYKNYTQIFKNTYAITGTAEQTHLRTGDPVANDKKRKAFDHSAAIEYAMIFGVASEGTGSNGKPIRTMAGIRSFLPSKTTTVFSAAYDLNDLLDAVSPVFDYDSSAGDTRMAFCGNGALNAINKKIAAASGQAALNIRLESLTKVYGMNFTGACIPAGTLAPENSPAFNKNSLYTNSMLIMDFSALKWRPMKNRDTKFLDDVQTKREDTREGYWQTEAGIELWHGGLTCGWIRRPNQDNPS